MHRESAKSRECIDTLIPPTHSYNVSAYKVNGQVSGNRVKILTA